MATTEKLPRYAVLAPAYGRDYKTAKAVIEDFKSGYDFKYARSDKYTSIRDVAPNTPIQLRFNQLRKVTTYTPTQQDLDVLMTRRMPESQAYTGLRS